MFSSFFFHDGATSCSYILLPCIGSVWMYAWAGAWGLWGGGGGLPAP